MPERRLRWIHVGGGCLALTGLLLAGTGFRVAAQSDESRDASDVLARMDTYAGHWVSDQKRGPEGARFHFEYDLEWADGDHTVARIMVTQVRPDGRTVVFEGYKGRRPSGDGVFYVGASPSGRSARGRVVLDGENFVTVYDGWAPDDSMVEIRDVFEPVEDGTFVSRTLLRRTPEEPWRQIAQDIWTRAGR